MLEEILEEALAALAYAGVGIALMVLGFVLVDVLTPGVLRHQIWADRNRNASILLGSNLVGVAIIVVAAISASESGLGAGLTSTAIYGLLGLVVMGLAFLLLDALTPGKLGEMLSDREPHPAVWVSAAVHVAVGCVVGVALL